MGIDTATVVSGAWSAALRKQIALAAVAAVPEDASVGLQIARLHALFKQLEARCGYDCRDRLQMPEVLRKENCGVVDEISVGSFVYALQALPNRRILSGGADNTIRIWSKGGDGKWSAEVLEGHTGWVLCLQALPDGRIVSCSQEGTIRIWDGAEVAGGAS